MSTETEQLHAELDQMMQKIRSAHSALDPFKHRRDASDMREQLADYRNQVRYSDDLRLKQRKFAEARQAMPSRAAVDQLCDEAHKFVAFDPPEPSSNQSESPEPKDTAQPAPEKEPVKSRPEAKKAPRPNSGRNSVNEVSTLVEALEKAGLTMDDVVSAAKMAHWIDTRRNVLRSKPKHQRTH